MAFTRFPEETFVFLNELRANNNQEWFHAHAREYQDFYVSPAKEFVEAAGPELKAIIPGINAEPRILGSIFRINRDVRHKRGGKPYKDHIDFWFWEGERRRAVSGLFARLTPEFLGVGAGCHGFDKERLETFRRAVADPRSGAALDGVAREIESEGYILRGSSYKRYPEGFAADGLAGRFLLFKALYVHKDEPVGLASQDGAMLHACLKHWRALAPLHRWITDHVQSADA